MVEPCPSCPCCGERFEVADPIRPGTRRGPAPGDGILCGACGVILMFGEDLNVYVPADPELYVARLGPDFGAVLAERTLILDRIAKDHPE